MYNTKGLGTLLTCSHQKLFLTTLLFLEIFTAHLTLTILGSTLGGLTSLSADGTSNEEPQDENPARGI